MPLIEIALLIAGAAVFIISFFVPDRKGAKENKLDKKAIDAAVMESLGNVQGRLEAVVDEAVSYAIEKSDRSMDRLTNEKMAAVNEYADSVLESINKNHQEVMFLYDMLNNKSVELKNTVREAQQAQSGVESGIERIAKAAAAVDATAANSSAAFGATAADDMDAIGTPEAAIAAEVVSIMQEEMKPLSDSVPVIQVSHADSPETANVEATEPVSAIEMLKGTNKKRSGRTAKTSVAVGKVPSLDLTANAGNSSGKNKNERILELHRMGKSNVEVARELGLGMGEVKLVIDLFEGSK